MSDALAVSMGGRIASIYKQNVKRRRFTTVVNEIESKRLGFLSKQLEYDRATEYNKLERNNDKMTNANDEMKAFQYALLKRIGIVKEESKMSSGVRPPLNLGRYGGASVEYIKAESEKYKRIRDPKKRRMIKTKIYLEQGKRDGRIKEFEPDKLGDLAEDILKLYKADEVYTTKNYRYSSDVANLQDVAEIEEHNRTAKLSPLDGNGLEVEARKIKEMSRATFPPSQPKRIILPPLQVKRSINPNSNYYRKISADYHKREAMRKAFRSGASPIRRRISMLEGITEEGDLKRKQSYEKRLPNNEGVNETSYSDNFTSGSIKFPVTSISSFAPQNSGEPKRSKEGSKLPSYEWDYSKPVGPVKVGKHLNDGQKFWKPRESVPQRTMKKIALPSIR